jgi:putative DNA primase/helicase
VSETIIDPLQQCADAIGVLSRGKKYPEEWGDALDALSRALPLLDEREREFFERVHSKIRESGIAYESRTEERRDIQAIERQASKRRQPQLIKMSAVKAEPIQWLWRRRIARGKLTLVVGDPGVSKSTLLIDVAARTTRGLQFPDDGEALQPGNVIMLTAEDDLRDTVKPRLQLANADCERIDVLEGVRCCEDIQQFDLGDIPILEESIAKVKPALLIIDPVVAYVPSKTDTNRDAHIRQVLAPVIAIAQRDRIAIVGICHLNKSEQQQVLYRVGGSIGYVGAARSVLAIAADPEDQGRRVIGRIKGNLGLKPADLVYEVRDRGGDLSAIEWSINPISQVSVESIIQSAAENTGERSDREEAKAFLAEVLDGGYVHSKEVIKDANGLGISPRTLNRAKSELGVCSQRVDGRWYWGLPKEPTI